MTHRPVVKPKAALALVAFVALVAALAYEAIKQAVAPGLSLWESHAVTVAFITVSTTVFAHLVFAHAGRIQESVRAAEVARGRSEAALHAFVNALPEPAFLIDANKICLATNQAMAIRIGRPVEDIVGHDLFSFLPGQIAESRIARIDEVLRTGKPVEFADERNGRTFSNHVFPGFDALGKVWSVAAVAFDVTELRAAEAALRERENLLRLGLDAARMGVWDWDPVADKVMLSADLRAWSEERGASIERPDNASALSAFMQIVHPDDRARVQTSLLDCAAGRIPVHEVRYRRIIARPEGETVVWHEARGRLFTDASGRRRVVGTLRDVTAEVEAGARERKAHDEVRQLNEQLERRVAERTVALTSANRELESFCYSVSHDLRAPLRSIDGFSQALLEDYGASLDDGARKYLDIVRTETQRMGHLIDDLLNLSRVTRAEMNPVAVDLAAVAREVIDAHRRRDSARQVEIIIGPDLLCAGDEGLLRIVLENLVANAWKFTRARPVAHIEIGSAVTDRGPAFFVRDDGVGFDMRYTHRLFEPFQRLHSMLEFEGTGIGLATVKRIVHKHGGRVWADGQVGVGATFFWTLGRVELEA